MQIYHPIQLNIDLAYQESQPVEQLRNSVARFWQIHVGHADMDYLVIPDGCVDIAINCSDKNQAYLIPSLRTPRSFHLGKNEAWFGVRFYPGIIPAVFDLNLAELRHQPVLLSAVHQKWSEGLTEQIDETREFADNANAANNYMLQTGIPENYRGEYRLEKFLSELYRTNGSIVIGKESDVTISARHMRRLFDQYVGVSPKKFARILRSQYFLQTLKMNPATRSFYELYYDQAHMIKEMKEMTGFTPSQLARILGQQHVRFLQS